jgi:hypothetical protein
MAICPACSRRASLWTVLKLDPDESYICPWCGAQLYVVPRRHRIISFVIAYLTVIIAVGGTFLFKGVGKVALLIALWFFLSPLVFSSWVVLKIRSRDSSRTTGVHSLQSQEEQAPPS